MFLVLSCSCLCPIHRSQVLSWEWRCIWSSTDRRCSNYIWVINNFIAYKGVTDIRGLTVFLVYIILDMILFPQTIWPHKVYPFLYLMWLKNSNTSKTNKQITPDFMLLYGMPLLHTVPVIPQSITTLHCIQYRNDERTYKLDFEHPLTHWGRDKMDAISQTPFSNAFS